MCLHYDDRNLVLARLEGWKWMTEANTVAYYATATIKALKSVQAPYLTYFTVNWHHFTVKIFQTFL
jgi:hypothetical protein